MRKTILDLPEIGMRFRRFKDGDIFVVSEYLPKDESLPISGIRNIIEGRKDTFDDSLLSFWDNIIIENDTK